MGNIEAVGAIEAVAIPTERASDADVKASFPRNAAYIVAFDTFWGLGAPLCLLVTAVPSYLLYLGSSKTLVQSVMVGMSLMTVLQIWSGRLFGGPRRTVSQAFLWAMFPACWLAYGGIAALGWGALPSWLWVPLFTAMCFGLAAVNNLAGPAYAEMVLENTPLGWRGRLASLRSLGLGAFGALGLWIASRLMGFWEAPANFHYCFMIGAAIELVSCGAELMIRDRGYAANGGAPAGRSALDAAKALLGNFNFRVFLVFYSLVVVAQNFGPLLIGYGKDVAAMAPEDSNKFAIAYFAGAFAIGVPVPLFADRFGFRLIAIVGASLLAAGFLIPVLVPADAAWLLVAYALVAGSLNLIALVLANLGSELVPEVKPATIIAVGSTLIMPLSLIAAPLAGRLVDARGPAGYLAVFVTGIALSLCAIFGFAAVIREPRTGQEIYVRTRGM